MCNISLFSSVVTITPVFICISSHPLLELRLHRVESSKSTSLKPTFELEDCATRLHFTLTAHNGRLLFAALMNDKTTTGAALNMANQEACTVTECIDHTDLPSPVLLSSRVKSVEQTKEDFLKLPKEVRNILAGGLAGMVAKSVVAPIDRIKILYQVSSKHFHLWDVPQVARKIVEQEGVQALWKGNTATMIRVFPYSGIQFMVFDKCKNFVLDRHADNVRMQPAAAVQGSRGAGLSPLESLISGSVAGAVSVLCTYPLDVTRAQLAVMKRKKHEHNLGFFGMISNNYKTEVSFY